MATFEENIQAARDSGLSDAEISQHFAGSKNTEEQGFVSKYKHDEARSKMGKVEGALDDTEQFVRAHPMASAAIGAGALAVGGAATALGAYALKERIRSNAEIRTAEAIAKQPASEAVQLQKEQFAYKQQKDAQDELIRSEKQNRIDEITKGKNQIDAAKQQAVQQQAQTAKQNNLTPEQATARSLSLPPAGSPIVGGNPPPAGTPSPVAALPPTTPVQNAAVQLGADAPSGVLTKQPAPAPPPPLPAPPVPPATPVAVVNADPAMQAIPDKGVKPKLTRLRGDALEAKNAQIAQLANNPPEVAGQVGMREQYKTPKGGTGPGGFNWLYNTKGEQAADIWKQQYGEKNVPYEKVKSDYQNLTQGPKPANMPSNLNAGTPKYIPNYIKGAVNPSVFAEGAQKIAASPFGQGVASTIKGGAAMLPFALATDVKQQNVGYRRELEQEMKKAKDPERQAQLQGELKKLDEDIYLKAMQRRFIDQNIPAFLRK